MSRRRKGAVAQPAVLVERFLVQVAPHRCEQSLEDLKGESRAAGLTPMIRIREEIRAVERGEIDPKDNPLKNAPHTAAVLTAADWSHPYSREEAAYPVAGLGEGKYWPPVGRIDNGYGDRHLVCTCPPLSDYQEVA